MHPAADPRRELSPELVLVSPELAAEARARLPDRPWEAFVPPPPPPLVLVQPSVVQEPRVGRRRPERRVLRDRRRRRRLRIWPAVAGLGIVVLLIASFLPASDSPTLEPAPKVGSGSILPTPGALYGFGADSALVISTDGRSIARVTSLPCLPNGATLDARIGPDGYFVFYRADVGEVRLELQGRFVEDGVVQGTYRVRTRGCETARAEFVARRR
jgi:hypothetical protein